MRAVAVAASPAMDARTRWPVPPPRRNRSPGDSWLHRCMDGGGAAAVDAGFRPAARGERIRSDRRVGGRLAVLRRRSGRACVDPALRRHVLVGGGSRGRSGRTPQSFLWGPRRSPPATLGRWAPRSGRTTWSAPSSSAGTVVVDPHQEPERRGPRGRPLEGVAALAADDAWAVGWYGQGAPSRTLIEHWDGTAWSIVSSPNKGPFPTGSQPLTPLLPTMSGLWAHGSRRRSWIGRSSFIGTARLGAGSEPERRLVRSK